MANQLSPSLAEALENLNQLHPFPAAASQLMSACDRESTTAREIAEIIACDPALSLRILQVANSPLYGFGGEIRSVDHAAVVLGLRTVKDVAVSAAVGQVFNSGDSVTATVRRKLWTHSLACGCFARLLAQQTQACPPEEAFLGGIVHDVGKLLLLDFYPDEYPRLTGTDGRSTVTEEQDLFGIDHAAIGQQCGESWGLPEEIHEAICHHHAPAAADFAQDLVNTVAAANLLTRTWQCETPGDADINEILNIMGDMSAEQLNSLRTDGLAELNNVLQAYS